jgi:hypothetical protein
MPQSALGEGCFDVAKCKSFKYQLFAHQHLDFVCCCYRCRSPAAYVAAVRFNGAPASVAVIVAAPLSRARLRNNFEPAPPTTSCAAFLFQNEIARVHTKRISGYDQTVNESTGSEAIPE